MALSVTVLIVGAALEDLLPGVGGVGLPILLTAVQVFACRFGLLPMALLALATGAMEDALSSLAPLTSGSYFLLVAAIVRWARLPRLATVLTYPGYQVWLSLWAFGAGVNAYTRILLAFPVGVLTALPVAAALNWAGRKVALDERG